MVPDAMLSSPGVSSNRSPKAQVVRGVVQGLLRGDWQGGDRLTEKEATERFGGSRTPVREALLELSGLGLIELRRNCGAVFRPFGESELQELYEVRALLEIEAARRAASAMDPAEADRMVGAFEAIREAGGVDPGWAQDRRFHEAVAKASGNRRLAAEIARYGDLVHVVREMVGEWFSPIHHQTAADHLAIARAIRDRDEAGAAGAMQAHLEQAACSGCRALAAMRGEG